MINHDEPSIFNTNEGQMESGIMVLDFVEDHGGYLWLTDKELGVGKGGLPSIVSDARRLLEYGVEKEGHWTGQSSLHEADEECSEYCSYQVQK